MNRFILLFLLITGSLFSQEDLKKQLHIQRTNTPPKIDGILDDEVWQAAEEAKDFIQFRPTMGVQDSTEIKTIVKLAYDDEAIYVGAYLYDDPKLIMKQLGTRDNFGQTDFFAVIFNPNNDGLNDTELFVFPTGNQADAIASPSIGEDFGWNSVWDSSVKIVDDGWIVEMKVPYRCLRFSKDVNTWGLQFHRHFRRDRTQYTWNAVDVSKGNIGLYHGELVGIENIEPPTRLSFYPFASGLVNSYDGETDTDFAFGMDLKYGITENFTLDATLIPDFSQAGFDNLVLNLGPFEQQFAEQRQFFTEGVDLFTKGDLFYSRRVGGRASGPENLGDNEEISGFPDKVKTLNAIKVSGRTKKGLGIGVFNAITEKTYGTIEDTLTGSSSRVVFEPLANYNILVIDQQFNKNSSVSLINTNVTRNGHFKDANVTGLLFDLSNKNNTYRTYGEVKMSNLNLPDGTQTGYSTNLGFGKNSGNYRFWVEHEYADTDYDINDMGILFRNNFNNFSFDASYRTLEPTEKFNSYYFGVWYNYNRLAEPSTYTTNNFGFNFNATTKKLFSFGLNGNFAPGNQYDYFEPRTQGYYFTTKNGFNTNGWISTNYNKKFALDSNVGLHTYFDKDRNGYVNYWFGFEPRIRFNDKLLIVYSMYADIYNGDRGFVTKENDDIIFGERDRMELVNSISGNYNFNPFHGITLTFRNYWSPVDYYQLFTLNEDGSLNPDHAYTLDTINDPNINFSTWNLDIKYSWQFAPGSFLTALYRNQLLNYNNASKDTYFESLSNLFDQPFQNVFSLRLQYFLDYNNLKHVFKKKNS